MDPRFTGEWTASELEEASSIVARLSNAAAVNNYAAAAAGDVDVSNNSKHDCIVRELLAWFPWKTMQEVIDLYVELAVEMTSQMAPAAQPAFGGGDAMNNYAGGDDFVFHPTFELANDNFGIPVLPEEEAMEFVQGMNYGHHAGDGMVFGSPSMEEIATMELAPAPVVVNDNEGEVNHGAGRRQPNTGRFWTTDEHRLFLRGLRVYGRGDWKNISKYFVTTRTPVQVSSHAQKYFRRLESSAAGKQRYSINDVGLHDADPWAMDGNYGGWQALAFAGGHLEPAAAGYGGAGAGAGHLQAHQQATSSVAAMNNVAQFWAPLLFNPQLQANLQQQQQQAAWNNDQQMIAAAAAPMEGTGNFVPEAYYHQQGGAYDLPADQWMMNNMF